MPFSKSASKLHPEILRPSSLEMAFSIPIMIMSYFPYSPPLLSSSTQLWAPVGIVIFCAMCFFKKIFPRIQKFSLFLLLIFLSIFVLKSLITTNPVSFSIHIFKYAVAFLFIWFGYFWGQYSGKTAILAAIIIWVSVAVIQIYFPGIVTSFVSGQAQSLGRGVPSFAPEPSFFAIHLSLLYLLLLKLWHVGEMPARTYILGTVVILIGLILSASGGAVLSVLFIFLIMLFDRKIVKSKAVRMFLITVVLFFSYIGFVFLLTADINIRAIELGRDFFNGDITSDASVMTRVFYIVVGVLSLLEGNVFGFELNAFETYGLSLFTTLPRIVSDTFLLIDPNLNGKIHSLFATFALDFGLLTLFFYVYFIYKANSSLNKSIFVIFPGKIVIISFIIFLSLLPVPVGSPLFFIVIGTYLSKCINQGRKQCVNIM